MRKSLFTSSTLVALLACGAVAQEPVTRTYYIAADEVAWDFAPTGVNQITGEAFGEHEGFWVSSGPTRIGKVYKKAIYNEYTDASFTTLKPRPPQWEHLGILGPLVRAEVGDTIKVVFRNNASFPASVHPHGVFYKKDSEGAIYNDGTEGPDKADDGVPTGGTHTYEWPVPERAGPGPRDGSSVLWMYHSHVQEVRDVNTGLMGPIIVTGPGQSREDGTPKDVDREYVIAFWEFEENLSWYVQENYNRYASEPERVTFERINFGDAWPIVDGEDPDFGPNFMESLNGSIYGHLPVLTMREGERVRWYLMGSTNFEVHAPHWHGNTVVSRGMNADTLSLVTMGMLVADMTPDNVGTWLFHCHVGGHFEAGMIGRYEVLASDSPIEFPSAASSGSSSE